LISAAWCEKIGKQVGTLGEEGKYGLARLSPDGRTVVLYREDPADATKGDLWLAEVQRGMFSRLTFHPAPNYSAVWSPDGSRVAFSGFASQVQIMSANGVGTPLTVTTEKVGMVRDWSPDGHTLILQMQNSSTGMDIYSAPVSDKPQPSTPVLHSPFDEIVPRISPAGRCLAYISNESVRG
jgi:Tol biopolymer transport system component